MNKLEETLQKILEKSIELAEQTGEFVMDQAPLLLQEFYRWHIMQCVLYFILAFIIFFAVKYVSTFFGSKKEFSITYDNYGREREIKSVKMYGRYYNPQDDYLVGNLIFKIGSFIPLVIIVFINLYKLLFILIAPKLYLIEYFI